MAKIQTLKPRIEVANTQRIQTSSGGWRTSEMTSAQRGYDYRWQKARAQYLRLHPLCVMCQARGDVVLATVVDHVVPHRGDKVLFWDETNWQGLCATDHSSVKQLEEKQAERG